VSRVSTKRLLSIAGELSERERRIVRRVAALRLVSHAQLRTIFAGPTPGATPTSTARTVRRRLARLNELGVLGRLSRRIGGVRAGSSGHLYYLGSVGQRLMAYWDGRGFVRGRHRPEPSERYVRHRLSVSQIHVDLVAAEQAGALDLLSVDAEPDCWRHYVDGFGGQTVLKPDAFVRVGIGAYEDRCFVEVDLGTESRSVVARKLKAYLDYFESGHEQADHGVFPRVLLLTDSEARRQALVDLCTRLPAETWRLFTVQSLDRAVEAITGHAEAVSEGAS